MFARSFLAVVALLSVAVYWAGLSGPFMFDDGWNLEPILLWTQGQMSWRETMFPQGLNITSRPVAMASFMLSTWIGGPDSFSFKAGNLCLHLACGGLGWWVLRRALREDPQLQGRAELIASAIVAVWLVHPLHVSTVLYAVQRMAQLSTLFTLLGVGTYLVARRQLIEGRTRAGSINLFISLPATLAFGLLSKQNAAVLPVLCAAVEFAYFSGSRAGRRQVGAFFLVFMVLPAAAVMASLAIVPQRLLSGYQMWDFTLAQKLLTQPRVIVDYMGMLLVPRGPLMGVYTDDYPVSTGMFSPPATLGCALLLVAITGAVIFLRRRSPSLVAGWLFFLGAHSLEASFLPIEMYYEHRNYLPSFGFFLAVVSLVLLLTTKLRTNTLSPRALGIGTVAALVLMLTVATFGRVLVWRDVKTIVELALINHPDSLRANFDMGVLALQRGDVDANVQLMRRLAASDDPMHRQLGNLGAAATLCSAGRAGGEDHLRAASRERLPKVTTNQAQSLVRLAQVSRTGKCGDMSGETIADHGRFIVDATTTQHESVPTKYTSRFALAQMYLRSGHWDKAERQAVIAWNASNDPKIGALVTRIYVHNGKLGAARSTLAALRSRVGGYEIEGQAELSRLADLIAARAKAADREAAPF